jgi:hypothetical protein
LGPQIAFSGDLGTLSHLLLEPGHRRDNASQQGANHPCVRLAEWVIDMTFKTKNAAPSAQADDAAPFALSVRAYMKRSGNSRSRVYELLRKGEIVSYLEGSHRKITMRSVKAREARLLAEAEINTGLGRDITKPGSRSASPPTTSRKPPPTPAIAAARGPGRPRKLAAAGFPPNPTHPAE